MSSALKALEDLGFEAIDSVPLGLLESLLPARRRQARSKTRRPLAIGVDVRTRDFDAAVFLAELEQLDARPDLDVSLLFMECDDDVLLRRYAETRHRHPLAEDRPLIDGIRHERRLMAPLAARAKAIIDTTDMTLGDLKRILEGHFASKDRLGLSIFVTSFAYRHGVPRESDLVFDVRFLKNPHYEARLKPLTGLDRPVAAFIRRDKGYRPFLKNLTRLLEPLLPRYATEGKSYLTIAVGCTGGRHRSILVAEELAAWLKGHGRRVQVRHRDLDLAPKIDHNRRPRAAAS
jgi:UPF0042 nucleotide-binding protein